MNRTDWFLALISYLLAIIALETISGATNDLFRDLGGSVSILVIVFLPIYIIGHILFHREGD